MLVVYVFLALLTYLVYRMYRSFQQIDLPGPTPWPVLGNVLQLDAEKPHLTLDLWHRQYNKVFTFYQLSTPVVVVGSAEAMHEVLVKKGADFAGRPSIYRVDMLCSFQGFKDGIVFSDPSPTWKMLRMAAHKRLKQYDHGLKRIEESGLEVSNDLVDSFRKYNGEPFDPRVHILNAVMNNLTIFLLGKKFSEQDKLFRKFLAIEVLGMKLFSGAGKHALIDVFPWLRFLGNETPKQMAYFTSKVADLFEEMKRVVADREDEFGSDVPMLVDLLRLLSEGNVEGGEARIQLACNNLIFAGSGTSTSTLHGLLNILTQYPKVQDKLHAEVDQVLADRNVTVADREAMPYTRATILETLRYTSIVPTSVPHSATRDTDIGGVAIPKGTLVMLNLFSCFHDESYWPEPFTFKPERFLNEDGQLVPADHINRKRLMAFGAGPRVCIGEVFALTRLFMVLVTVMQAFNLEHPEPKVSCDPRTYNISVVLEPTHYKIKMTPRNSNEN